MVTPHSGASVPQRKGSSPLKPRDPARLQRLAEFVSGQEIDERESRRRQREIYDQTLLLSRAIDRPNFSRVSSDDVARMVRMYDERFFGGMIVPTAEAEGLTFKVSSRMTRIAGKLVTHYPGGNHNGRRKFELVLSSTLLFQTFEDVNRPVEVTGCRCANRLEAMQRVTEHELVHLVEMLIWNDGNCSQSRFQSIAKRHFNHTDYQHDLITQRERAAAKFNIRVGDTVRFAHDGRYLTGRVNRITRRATILVPHAQGERFSDGGRYLRFYVPLEKLTLVRS
tara:strand:+ start:175990 stop:176832 length:843 start_codon:yes stop_codon:yes gene_type:complete